MEKVILVDEKDHEIGTMEKMEAHRKGLLHRAISVFIIDNSGNWLLQKRATGKYHSNGLWSNTACSHPLPNETILQAANRRLDQEMGIKADLIKIFDFIYHEPLDANLFEHELDHVFLGITNDLPKPNPEEVSDWKLINFNDLNGDIQSHPENYTVWFKKIYELVNQKIGILV
jgi:isopentenyl-diphosphate delta-isomerase